MKLRKTFIVLLLHGATKCSDFLSHVEDSILAVEDRIAQTRSLEELEEAYAYGDKSRFQDMFYDLNSFYPEHTENNQNHVKQEEPEVKEDVSTERSNYEKEIDDYGFKRSPKQPIQMKKEERHSNSNFMKRRGFIGDDFHHNSPIQKINTLWSENIIREGIGKDEKDDSVGFEKYLNNIQTDLDNKEWGQWGLRHIRKTPNYLTPIFYDEIKNTKKTSPSMNDKEFDKDRKNLKKEFDEDRKNLKKEYDSSTEEQFLSEIFETTTSKMKLRDKKRRKKRRKTKFSKVLLSNISKEETNKLPSSEFAEVLEQKLLPNFNNSEEQIENNINELVSRPMTEEWKNLFVPFVSSSSSTSTETTTTKKKNKFNFNPRIRKVKQNQNSGIFQTLYSTYCGFEEALQILQMCKSSKSLEEKSYVKQENYIAKPNYSSDLFSNNNILSSAVDAFRRIFH